MRIIAALLLPVLLAGCVSIPIKGKIENGSEEKFLGVAEASLFDGDGHVKITTENSATCTGSYPRPIVGTGSDAVSVSGTISCSDNRGGNFSFAGTARQGVGFGKFSNGEKFTFVYGFVGSDNSDAAMIMALQAAGQNMKQATPPTPAVVSIPPIYSTPHPVHCTTSPSLGGGLIETNCN